MMRGAGAAEESIVELRSKRVYLPADESDGNRVLVDRLWPRGLSKEKLGDVAWIKDVAPSDALRKWFGHEPAKWDEFRKRYFAELDANPEGVTALRGALVAKGRNTLLFGTREEEHNNAVALCEYLRTHRRR
ncbi:DUF488 domain-containing protein [Luteimonas mephitis]|jgi:uncharacterized protein YeaO (DUF488 family)|uniref:DUF488 domain-containing protein n=1 Tax=Luteimonas mephitis TaxID=83615 RepID=UPI001FE1756A|nr:DUF488 family protein [Luteimonas mephitis]